MLPSSRGTGRAAALTITLGAALSLCCSSDGGASAEPPAGLPAAESPMPEVEPTSPVEPGAEPAEPAAPGALEGNPNPGGIAGGGAEPAAGSGVEPLPEPPPAAPTSRFILGADISSVQEAVESGTVFTDTDGVDKPMLELLRGHGFNFVRLRTFVSPSAEYGYASGSGCTAKAEAYNDTEHTVEFAREVKAAGLGLLVDLHYSDTWADPAKQVIPEAWRGASSVEELAERVRSYTVEVVGALVAAGARPDMVQVGNEITPGMLIHIPTEATDCYGNGSAVNPGVNGSQNDWDSLAQLLRAGVEGVREVDPSIEVMLHIENTESAGGIIDWVQNAQQRGVELDVLGLSAYEAFQGPSTAWRETLTRVAEALPELSFSIAEYNPERRLLNDIMRELPDGRGRGTFFWEPTQSGSWGQALFTWQGNRATANAGDFAEYDQMRSDFGL
jgi:arabinogalactan endo-1,4-beta-galactosidase